MYVDDVGRWFIYFQNNTEPTLLTLKQCPRVLKMMINSLVIVRLWVVLQGEDINSKNWISSVKSYHFFTTTVECQK